MKSKPVSKERRYEVFALLEACRRLFGTDDPAVARIELELGGRETVRLINNVYDAVVRERKEINP